LDEPVKAYNVDGTEKKRGMINAYVNLEFKLGDQKFNERFYVTGLGKQKIILGFSWLHKYNPIIDWKKGEIMLRFFTFVPTLHLPFHYLHSSLPNFLDPRT
jgi:hypothetical protein